MKSYSQSGEDRIIADLLATIHTGALLDIGAWDPEALSNSRALIETGRWSAVLIEPSPGPLRNLIKFYGQLNERERVKIIGAAVSLEGNHLLDMAITDDAVSTSEKAVEAIWAEQGGYLGRVLMPTITLEQISLQFGGFQFVNIDAEGLSVDIARRLFDLGWKPQCICVEYDDRLAELLSYAGAAGYAAVHTNGTNTILERR